MNLIEVELKVDEKIIIESLSRIGIASKKEKILWPSAYLYQNENKNYIVHFKTLFVLKENGYDNTSKEDLSRLSSIIYCLKDWGLIDVDESLLEKESLFVFILPYAQKKEWKICHKYKVSYNTYEQ